jgi:hypothetical protein
VSCEWGRGAGFATSPDPSQPNSHAELVNWPGSSLVGQIGVLVAPNGGMIAVALAARPDSGKFDDGTADLTHDGRLAQRQPRSAASGPMQSLKQTRLSFEFRLRPVVGRPVVDQRLRFRRVRQPLAMTGITQIITLAESVGVTAGHEEATAFIEHLLSRQDGLSTVATEPSDEVDHE